VIFIYKIFSEMLFLGLKVAQNCWSVFQTWKVPFFTNQCFNDT
jgi:hypothetical protein